MNAVREKVWENMNPYTAFAEHRDLVAFTVGADYFTYDHENDELLEADFYEIVVVVEKDWLFELMKKNDIENPLDYLQNEYTWDDSIEWFEDAKRYGKVVTIDFT